MSYAVTDAVEDDARKEMKILEQLNEDIDQLSATARDCDMLAPKLKTALDIAWWITEDAMRDVGAGSCGHALQWKDLVRKDVKRGHCACCAHYMELYNRAKSVERHL